MGKIFNINMIYLGPYCMSNNNDNSNYYNDNDNYYYFRPTIINGLINNSCNFKSNPLIISDCYNSSYKLAWKWANLCNNYYYHDNLNDLKLILDNYLINSGNYKILTEEQIDKYKILF